MSEKNENVSVDEMMQNLKRGNGSEVVTNADAAVLSEGTLVTRADGSKAVKVKHHKRRSRQPRKEQERKSTRNRVIFICSSIFLIIMMGIGFIVTLAYYNGNKFSEKLATTMESRSGADAEIRGLSVSLMSARVMQLNLDWSSPNSVVDYIKLDGLDAGYSIFSFFGGGWSGPEASAARGEMRLNLLESPDQISSSGEEPIEFDFATYKCNELNAIIGQDENWMVKNTQAEFSINTDGLKQIYLYGGEFKAPSFENYNIKSGVFEIKQALADISLVLQPKSRDGSVTLAGEVGYKNSSDISLSTQFSDVDMKDWVDAKTQRFINGDITKGEGFFKMKLGDYESKEILTHVETNKVRISTFSFIETLALEMKDRFYSRPTFHNNSKFTMNWLKDKVVFSNINLEETSHMQVKGGFVVHKSGKISGKLKIGIPIASLSPIEVRRLKKIFKEDDGDLIWTEVTIAGTIASPTDDLGAQFERAKDIERKPSKSAEDAFNQINDELSE